MNTSFKNLVRSWLLPPEVFESLFQVFTKINEIKHIDELNRNLIYKDVHKGKRCFIVGNGPSIKKVDLKKLRNEYTFVVNHFFQHKDTKIMKPDYYCIIDREHFKDTSNSKKFFRALENKINKQTTFFFPIQYSAYVKRNQLLKKHAIHYLMLNGNFSEKLNFNVQIEKSLPGLINVVLACILVASYMGFSEIYLLGVDHDWLKERTFGRGGRFYERHYFENDEKNSYEYASYCQSELFKSYRLLKEKLKNTKIINCTDNSYLDVFEFKKLNQVLKK